MSIYLVNRKRDLIIPSKWPPKSVFFNISSYTKPNNNHSVSKLPLFYDLQEERSQKHFVCNYVLTFNIRIISIHALI